VAWSQRLAPWGHFTVFTVMAALAWVLREHGPTQLSPSLRAVVWCEDAAAGSGTCAAMTDKQAVLRVTLAGSCFFLTHCLLTVGVKEADDTRHKLHGGGVGAWTIRVRAGRILVVSVGDLGPFLEHPTQTLTLTLTLAGGVLRPAALLVLHTTRGGLRGVL
jgi:hypothetical protein